MTFEESKLFELTKKEEGMIQKFAKEYGQVIRNYGPWGMPSTFAVQDITKRVVDELGDGLWFFGKALNEVSSVLSRRDGGSGNEFEKTLSDRSVVRFGEGDLEKNLYDIGRYYFAKTFDHGYESLKSLSKSWIDLDEYVKQRDKHIKLDKIIKKLPELEGIL